jgi:hypothetical protein
MSRRKKASTLGGEREKEQWLGKERGFLLRGKNMHMFEMHCNKKIREQWLGGAREIW